MKSLNAILQDNCGNYIAPFLWLHNEEDSRIVEELHHIHNCGIGAVCIESRTHEEFCREDWWSDVRLILDTCKELGMKLWILDDKHFPSGYANGIFKKPENQHLRATCIRARHIDMVGPVTSGSILADEWKELPEDQILGAVALRRTEDGSRFDGEWIDLTENGANGRYYFDLPEGVWSIVLLIETMADYTPYFRDYGTKLSTEATDAYIEEVYEGHYKHFAEEFGNTLLGFFSDEPAFYNFHNNPNGSAIRMGDAYAGYPWHPDLMPLLESEYGTATRAMLCRLWYDFSDTSHYAVRERYMDIITKRYSECFNQRIGKWCQDHGCLYIGHIIEDSGAHKSMGCGPGHYFRALQGQHMSGVDVVLHQLMPGLCEVSNTGPVSYRQMDNKLNHYILGKLASSAAHIDAKKKGRAMCEIFGAFGWAEDTEFMKFLTDHFLVRGINYFVPHAFSPKENDTDCPPNFYNTGKNPQYKYFGRLMQYMNRMCALTEDATHVPTCAVIYDAEADWATGEYTDNKDICKTLYDAQLDYDLVPFDSLDNISEDGLINGEYYPIILLPYSDYYSSANRKKLERLRSGILCVGEKTIDGFAQVGLHELVDRLEEYRDLTVYGNAKYLRYSHYTRGAEQCYILSNENVKETSVTLRLRNFSGGDYVLWDAFENQTVRRFSQDGSIQLTVVPNNLTVLFIGTEIAANRERLIWETYGPKQTLFPVWKIELAKEKELPNYRPYLETTVLKSITAADMLPDFTGNMRYTATIPLDAEKHRILDLGTVGQCAEVRLNGIHVGTRLFAPYRFDISGAVQNGNNTLEIIVANTCVYEQRDLFSRYMLIKPSGLLGPVTVS